MSPLLCLVALVAPVFAQNCPGQCPCNVDLFRTGYLTYASPIADSPKLDNVCYTFFPVSETYPCTYVAYFSKTYCDNTNEVISFLVSCNSTNQLIYTSPDCSFVETKVGEIGETYLYYRSIISGECNKIIYPALGSSRCPVDGSSSDLDQVNQIFSNQGYGCAILYEVPKQYPYQCVNSQASSNTGDNTNNCPSPSPSPCPCAASGYPSYSYSYSPPSNCPYSK